ncbi:DUF2752 domain-containing protein [Gordonia sp. SL306]|uniref:DUF2752 domain-containing protein n=1 Tax=Gordonia sp. SL306 TaxID=2995145 RepID=UPI0022720AD2|nr:DUF2752 domain-containing protein [Gordonia sp. SL306]WAC56270.1 DUF2752 domain-containing protein [Gordonia sp. SL306]
MTSGEQATVSSSRSAEPGRLGGAGRLTVAAVGAAGLTALGLATVLGPQVVDRGPILCPFLRITGLPCPACGLTRSWVALGHGDVGSAFSFNAFGPLFMLVVAVVTVVAIGSLVTGRPALTQVQRTLTSPVALAVLVVWFGYGIARAVDAGFGWGVFPAIT